MTPPDDSPLEDPTDIVLADEAPQTRTSLHDEVVAKDRKSVV